jgi:hypothetical protein
MKKPTILEWMKQVDLRTNKGLPVEFKDHGFLLDYLKDDHNRIVVRKCTQVGASFTTLAKALYYGSHDPLTIIYCVDPETEIMTANGWRFYKSLKVGDEIITLNMKTGKSEWKPLNEVFVKRYKGDMIKWEGRNISALTTPDHKWPVQNKSSNKLFFKQTREIKNQNLFIPKAVEYNNNNIKIYDDDFVELFSWIYTEGYYPKSEAKIHKYIREITRITISQSYKINIDHCNCLENLFKRMNIKYTKHKMKANGCYNFTIIGSTPFQIRKLFPDKKPTADFIRSLTKEQLEIFIDTSIKADGWIDRQGTRAFIQKDKDIVDIFSLACVLAGYPISVQQRKGKDRCYVIRLIKYNKVYTNQIERAGINKRIPYNNIVWCPSTENGTFLAKRGHSVYWTGNTLPTSPEAKNFVLSKFDPMIERSPGLRKMVDRPAFRDKPIFNTVVKRIGESYYFFRGSWTNWGAQSIDADVLIVDELDFQKQEIRKMWEERTQGSASKDIILWIGYPSVPGFGIEELYEDSDQRMWFIECPHCLMRQTLTFPESINMETEQYICKSCKKELTDEARSRGLWKPTKSGSNIHGYWINKLMAPWIPAKKILERFKADTPRKFFNYSLGLPYLNRESDLTDQVLDQAMIDEEQYIALRSMEGVKVICGIDQGDVFHMVTCLATQDNLVVVGKDIINSEDELEVKLNYYNPSMIVMDALPNRHTSKKIGDKMGLYRFYMALERMWSEDGKTRDYWRTNRSTNEVSMERTESIDSMIDLIINGVIKFRKAVPGMVTKDKSQPGVIDMLRNLVPDVQERFGRQRRIWKAVGPDHFGHSLNFAVVGARILMPGWQITRNPHAMIPTREKHDKPEKPWYVKDFENRINGLLGNENVIIPTIGERSGESEPINPRIVF